MKRKVLIIGIVILLVLSVIVLTGCTKVNEDTEVIEDVVENTEENKVEDEILKDYTYEGLSFKLPAKYGETPSDNSDVVIYSSEIEGELLRVFSVGTISAEGYDYIENAADALKMYEFKLPGYDVTSRKDPAIVEYNGNKAVVVDVNYNSPTVNGDARVEYSYMQNDDTVYVVCFELFSQNGKTFTDEDFANEFNKVKDSLTFVEENN